LRRVNPRTKFAGQKLLLLAAAGRRRRQQQNLNEINNVGLLVLFMFNVHP